jgi:hypothetical protein
LPFVASYETRRKLTDSQSSRKFNATEVPIALLAAALTGAGTVALSCAVGVNV